MAHGLRLGIIGAGTITQAVHLEAARRAGFVIAAICDLSPSRAQQVAAQAGARATTDPSQVVAADDVDAVLIATPAAHAPLAVAALEAGKHVLIEKPVALSEAGIEDVRRAAATSGAVAQVGYMKLYDPVLPAARRALADLSDVRLVRVTVAHPADAPQVAHLRMSPPALDADAQRIRQDDEAEAAEVAAVLPDAPAGVRRYYRNVLNGSVIHELSLLRGLGLTLPTHWQAQVFPALDGPEPGCLLATGAVDGTRFVLSWNWLPELPAYTEEVAVLAGNGTVTLDVAPPYQLEAPSRLTVSTAGPNGSSVTTTVVGPPETGFLRQLEAFAAAIQDGHAPAADLVGALADVRQTVLLAQAVTDSLNPVQP